MLLRHVGGGYGFRPVFLRPTGTWKSDMGSTTPGRMYPLQISLEPIFRSWVDPRTFLMWWYHKKKKKIPAVGI